jgi:FAD/FMN-containing dehydrogenase
VLDDAEPALKPHGLWFPVDVSTASRATIGGMAANNSCGGRSIRYGNMRDNVIAIDACWPTAARAFRRGARPADGRRRRCATLVRDLLALGAREADEIAARFPDVLRRVGGYNIDAWCRGETT